MVQIKFKNLRREKTRHGKINYYVRIGDGTRFRIYGEPGTQEFSKNYFKAIENINNAQNKKDDVEASTKIIKFKFNSIGWFVQSFYFSAAWQETEPATQKQRRLILNRLCRKSGNFPISSLNIASIIAAKEELSKTPHSANNLIKALRALFEWGITQGIVKTNIAKNVKTYSRPSEGFKPWSINDVKKFREFWAIGTMPRLAMELLLFTGVRRGDVVRLTPSNLRDGNFKIRPQKTKKNSPDLIVTIPLHSELKKAIEKTPRKGLTYIETQNGTPYTKESFGNIFRVWSKKAGLESFSPHGGRKLGAALLAEAGATERQLMAAFGWTSARMAQHYTQSADRAVQSIDAWELLKNNNRRTTKSVRQKSQKS